jgi:hypothetical protein
LAVERHSRVADIVFGEPEVGNMRSSTVIEQDVSGLQVTVNNSCSMRMMQGVGQRSAQNRSVL